jgi:hypothetical protein
MLENFATQLNGGIDFLNTNKYFGGIMMLLLNIGGKQISKEISFLQENFLNQQIVRRLLVFVVVFIATKDIKVSFIITILFIILVSGVFHEESKFCMIPKSVLNNKTLVSKQEYNYAKEIIAKYEKENQ